MVMGGVFDGFEQFVSAHRACGDLVGDASPATETGYRLWLKCKCGAAFERWVSADDAASDLVFSRMLAGEN